MTGLKAKIQETLRSMSTASHEGGTSHSFATPEGGLKSVPSDTQESRGKSAPRRRKRWRSKHPLREFRLLRGLTLEELADQTDLSPSYLSRLESGSRRLNADILQKLSEALGCHPGDLLISANSDGNSGTHDYGYSAQEQGHAYSYSGRTSALEGARQAHNTHQHDLPLYHLATTPDGVQTIDFSHPTEWMARPTELSEVLKAYAISLPTDIMSPRYYAGERLLAHPSKPLTPRCFVVITSTQGHVVVGQFMGWKSSETSEMSLGPIQANENDKLVIVQIGEKPSQFPGTTPEGRHLCIPRKIIGSISRIVGNLEAA